MKTIELTVTPQGEVTVLTKGFTGSDCRQASRFLESALGQATSEQLTPEFYQTQQIEPLHLQQKGTSSQ